MVLALSLRQPLAGYVAHGAKRVEIQTFHTDYRGPVLICASKGKRLGRCSWPLCQPLGVTLCLVELTEVTTATAEIAQEHAFMRANEFRAVYLRCLRTGGQPHAWHFNFVRQVRQIPIVCQPGLFKPARAVLRKLGFDEPENIELAALKP